MANNAWLLNAVTGAPAYSGRVGRQVMSAALDGATAARPLGARSGVRPRTPSTTCTATSTTWTINPHAGILDTQTSAIAGPYWYAIDVALTGAVTAAHATWPRKDALWVGVNDPVEDGSSVPAIVGGYTAGTAAASPTPPATPARCMRLATIDVPASGGGSPTCTFDAPVAVAAGGVSTVTTAADLTDLLARGTAAHPVPVMSAGKMLLGNGTVWETVLSTALLSQSGTGTLSADTTERIISGCHLSLAVGTWDVWAKATPNWSTSGGTPPQWTLRLRTGGVGGTEKDKSDAYTGQHLGNVTLPLMARIVVASPTTVDVTAIVTGPASGTTQILAAVINATPVP
jgi:hypothetical protein